MQTWTSPDGRANLQSKQDTRNRHVISSEGVMSCFIKFQGLGVMTAISRAPRLFAQLTAILVSLLLVGNSQLTFKNRALYIGRAYRYPPDVAFFIFFSTTISTEYFKHAAHSPFFSSKWRLFHNATFFGSCIIHILHTGCAKI